MLEIKIDEPLPDDLFEMEFTEGVEVYDRTHEPPLSYKHKKNFTPDEWQAIVDAAKENQRFWDEMKQAQQALIGASAPEFSDKCEWINSKPLSWNDMKGKVVLIDFFADWCGPCRNDLPAMARLHQQRDKLPFMVMGIHPPGSERQSIDKLIKEFDLQYPICIDLPQEGAWGKLFAAYNVKAIPHTVVVDGEGKIAAQGSLGDMIAVASRLGRK